MNIGDRFLKFGIRENDTCVLCKSGIKSHNHLFFECLFSSRVWQSIIIKCNTVYDNGPWQVLVDFLSNTIKHKSLGSTIKRLDACKPVSAVVQEILDKVRCRVLALKNVKKDGQSG